MYSHEERLRAVKLYIKLGSAAEQPFASWVTRRRIRCGTGIRSSWNAVTFKLTMYGRHENIRLNREKLQLRTTWITVAAFPPR